MKQLATRFEWTTPRRRGGGSGRAVLAYVPDYKGMALAVQCAGGSALAVVAHAHPSLAGWAMESSALNLVTGEPTRDDRPAELIGRLEYLHQCGNNGWTTSFDKSVVPRVVATMRDEDLLDPDLVLGYMVARGHSASSIENLAGFITRA